MRRVVRFVLILMMSTGMVQTLFSQEAGDWAHEGFFMLQRARFGLLHWNELPEQDRRTVVQDILWSAGYIAEPQYRKILATKPEPERDNIRAALLASGFADKKILQELGM